MSYLSLDLCRDQYCGTILEFRRVQPQSPTLAASKVCLEHSQSESEVQTTNNPVCDCIRWTFIWGLVMVELSKSPVFLADRGRTFLLHANQTLTYSNLPDDSPKFVFGLTAIYIKLLQTSSWLFATPLLPRIERFYLRKAISPNRGTLIQRKLGEYSHTVRSSWIGPESPIPCARGKPYFRAVAPCRERERLIIDCHLERTSTHDAIVES